MGHWRAHIQGCPAEGALKPIDDEFVLASVGLFIAAPFTDMPIAFCALALLSLVLGKVL